MREEAPPPEESLEEVLCWNRGGAQVRRLLSPSGLEPWSLKEEGGAGGGGKNERQKARVWAQG